MNIGEIPKQYNPHDTEKKWLKFWDENAVFEAKAGNKAEGDKVYSIVIPPPNVTGILHMGHALNNTIQDILIRYKRMSGYNVVWIPGTDHAGIATQNVVEKKLARENKTKTDLGREEFLKEVWDWKEHHGSTIIDQLKKIGASCDWSRERFTMDAGLSKAVQEVFIRLYNKDLIYRGNYIIHWCPRCKTALSDEEAEFRENKKGRLYYIKYPVGDGSKFVTVATTRPETLLGDVALAINPDEFRYHDLLKQDVLLPILNRKLKIIRDSFVDPSFGTGVVKVTPAHDPNDFDMGKRHNLEPICIMDEAGIMNENAGPYQGMDRFACREKLVEDLQEAGLLDRIEPHEMSIRHCYRCDTVVEPRLSPQWFVKMKPLAEPAVAALKEKKLNIYPERWEKVYLEWMENIHDWCISRQIWWGHRIPIWYCDDCNNIMASADNVTVCDKCESKNLRQEEDVLDTWFSSWLWPFTTFGWPDKTDDLDFYYPTNTLVTAQEIIFFWVARMVMAGIEFMDKIPFSEVYIHGTVRDDSGTKMSKSLGNTIDPLDIVRDFGADALRYSIISITACGQDVYLSPAKFEIGRNFANKIWNASRFLLMNLEGVDGKLVDIIKDGALDIDLSADDLSIIYKLNQTIESVEKSLETYRFNDAASSIYDFFWHEYCDKYIEIVKNTMQKGTEIEKQRVGAVLFLVLDYSLRLLHPFMPFITEEIWFNLQGATDNPTKSSCLTKASWPTKIALNIDPDIVKMNEIKYELIGSGRNLRSEYSIAPKTEVEFFVKPQTKALAAFLKEESSNISKLLKASSLKIDTELEADKPMPSGVLTDLTIYMSLSGAIDVLKESERLEKQLIAVTNDLNKVQRKLANQEFVNNAPAEIVEKQRAKEAELSENQNKIKENIIYLQG